MSLEPSWSECAIVWDIIEQIHTGRMRFKSLALLQRSKSWKDLSVVVDYGLEHE